MQRLVPFLVLCLLAASPAAAAVLITIDKTGQRMSVAVDGEGRYSWPVSTGMGGYATPAGSFAPFRMERDHYSKEWDDAPMPHSIFFTRDGHAIHGTDATGRLGTPASHGCVRLSRAHAERLFALVTAQGLGQTRVVIEGVEPARGTRPARRAVDPWDEEDPWGDVDPLTRGIMAPSARRAPPAQDSRRPPRGRSEPRGLWD